MIRFYTLCFLQQVAVDFTIIFVILPCAKFIRQFLGVETFLCPCLIVCIQEMKIWLVRLKSKRDDIYGVFLMFTLRLIAIIFRLFTIQPIWLLSLIFLDLFCRCIAKRKSWCHAWNIVFNRLGRLCKLQTLFFFDHVILSETSVLENWRLWISWSSYTACKSFSLQLGTRRLCHLLSWQPFLCVR